ncbi:MAG: hypothetical protein OEM96_09170 [Gemmatimonadota bacterium]|nr:hypothetical protein [Gemmatimonadota bacterium]
MNLRTAVLLLCAWAGGVGSLPAQTLEGRVVHGVDSSAVAGARVELHRVTATSGSVVDSTLSARDGSFSFDIAEASGAGELWLAAARAQGILYFGPARHAGQGGAEPYEVVVFDSLTVRATPEDLRVGIRHLVVTRGQVGGFDIVEVVDVLGPRDRTLVPVPDTIPVWSTSLPASARDPRALEGGAPPEAVAFSSGRVELRSMISPVGVRLTYVYSTPDTEVELVIEHPTDRLEVVVAGMTAEVSGATPAGISTMGGQTVQRYEARAVTAGTRIRVAVADAPGVGGRALLWALVGAALLLAAGVLWWTGSRDEARLRTPPAVP